jgi:hypothetical protein
VGTTDRETNKRERSPLIERVPTPGEVFLWSVVAFAICVEILVVVAMILAMVRAF